MQADIAAARRRFAEDIRAAAPVVHDPRIVEAFARVEREQFLGDGPWMLHPRAFDRPPVASPSADPRHVYHDLLISIDDARGLNSGLPSLWAYYLDKLDIKPGETLLQVGAGVGYFTAIMAELVGASGRVIGYEIDAALATRARAALRGRPNVEIIAGDATAVSGLPALDVIVAFAGATHVPEPWLAALAPGGRMAVPFTGSDGWGFMLRLEDKGGALNAASLGRCGFYPCGGARSDAEAEALSAALRGSGGSPPPLSRMERSDGLQAWYAGDGFRLVAA
ncbi:MAG: protein-L-isoaspartate O-methyltransferase family protein [Pikeienuella sp.]|uniref:protein-L-isoaspartate O-methyltransferase family protein n=1 Tax=Pikeienuella sp. TaxID=2831957 RepID=UPI00391CDC9D